MYGNRKYYSLLDLFSGCGGMSIGFQRAGFDILGGVEYDVEAAKTYAKNLFRFADQETIERHGSARDINNYPPNHFALEFLNTEDLIHKVDVIIGGPPCQAFARIGRAKLRAIMEHEDAFLNDQRADLYLHFLMYVEQFKPKVVVMENVPEILSFGGKNVGEEIAVSLGDLGYRAGYSLLNAAHFGVPQTRVRFFLIAYRNDLGLEPAFPNPSHDVVTRNNMYVFPANGRAEKSKVMQHELLDKERWSEFDHYIGLIDPGDEELPYAVSVGDAIGDLKVIDGSRLDKPPSKDDFAIKISYQKEANSDFVRSMREWPGFETDVGVDAHVVRSVNDRDFEIYKRMKPGDQYPQAYAIAWENFARKIKSMIERGESIPDRKSKAFDELMKSSVPPYPTDKFPNKWQKLDPDEPAHTITAHLSKDTYSHIHYDSNQARTISVREAARLQSFPDGFRFPATLTHSFRQIGNAVPPLLAYRIAEKIRADLESAD